MKDEITGKIKKTDLWIKLTQLFHDAFERLGTSKLGKRLPLLQYLLSEWIEEERLFAFGSGEIDPAGSDPVRFLTMRLYEPMPIADVLYFLSRIDHRLASPSDLGRLMQALPRLFKSGPVYAAVQYGDGRLWRCLIKAQEQIEMMPVDDLKYDNESASHVIPAGARLLAVRR